MAAELGLNPRTPRPKTTVVQGDTLTAPQTTAAGDAPADTYDPKERVSSAQPDKGTAAAAGHKSVNAVVKTGVVPTPATPAARNETYDQKGPDGTVYTVTHNIATGATTKVPKV